MSERRDHHRCHFCGGEVVEKWITVDYRWGRDLVAVLKNVPAGVCGEEYFKADVVKEMENAVRSPEKPGEFLQVPVRELRVA